LRSGARGLWWGQPWEILLNDETFNPSLRKFLRTVGVTSQQEI
jgi:hypothetical protein